MNNSSDMSEFLDNLLKFSNPDDWLSVKRLILICFWNALRNVQLLEVTGNNLHLR